MLTPALLADLPFPRPSLCEYGDVCTKAHSQQELQEWIQRTQTLKLREQAAWQEGLVSYQARLLAEYQRSRSEVLVVSGDQVSGQGVAGARAPLLTARLPVQLAENVEGVSITCPQPLVHQAHERKTQHSWVFDIQSEVRISSPGLVGAWGWSCLRVLLPQSPV